MMQINKPHIPKVSVVIPTYNRSKYLNELLHSISKQSFKDFEVIVVNDGSTDDTKEMLLGWMENGFFDLKILHQQNKGAATARNKGVSVSRGEIIAFIDDDCLADENWLREGVKYFDDKDIFAVTGQIEKEDRETTPTSCVTYTFNANGFMTANVFYRKTAFKKVGGFDTNFTSFREDTDLGIRIAKLGTVVNEPDCKVTHRIIDYSVWSFFKKHIKLRETYFDVLFYKKHPLEFRDLGEFFIGPITTHMLWAYCFLFFCFILSLSWLFKTPFVSAVAGFTFGTGYFWTTYHHTKMRSNIEVKDIGKHPFKFSGLVCIWWIAFLYDIYLRLVAMIKFRQVLL